MRTRIYSRTQMLYMSHHTTILSYYICVLIRLKLYIQQYEDTYILEDRDAIYQSSYYYVLLYMCPHTTICVISGVAYAPIFFFIIFFRRSSCVNSPVQALRSVLRRYQGSIKALSRPGLFVVVQQPQQDHIYSSMRTHTV